MDGSGTYESEHGGRYIGDFMDGLYHGDGILYVKNGYFKVHSFHLISHPQQQPGRYEVAAPP